MGGLLCVLCASAVQRILPALGGEGAVVAVDQVLVFGRDLLPGALAEGVLLAGIEAAEAAAGAVLAEVAVLLAGAPGHGAHGGLVALLLVPGLLLARTH